MKTLKIQFTDLSTNTSNNITFNASNFYILKNKFYNFLSNNISINEWDLFNNDLHSGNKGINADAYLHETLSWI